jgi:PTS system beta-glucosides-specific IIC component
LIGSAIAIILPIVLIQIFGYGDDTTQEVENDADVNNNQKNQPLQETLETTVSSPMNGILIPLSDVNDPIFSQEMMGKGIAIKSEENTVHSPIKGTISMVTPTKHAIGITSDDGIEILIHIGLDTVKLNGEGYELLVQENDKVDVGIPLINFDNATITKQGFDIITPLIITNSDEFSDIIPTKKSNVVEKESILTIIKK